MSDINVRTLARMLRLRHFALFEHADLDELATIAENLVETKVSAGTVIAAAGSRLRGIHLVMDGCIETEPRGESWGAHQAYGALEVFANREVAHTAIAVTAVHTLELLASDIGEVLEDNYGVLLATLRQLAARVLAVASPQPRNLALRGGDSLGLVERLIILRQQLPFATARLQALASLAHASDEVTCPAGTTITRAGDPATTAFVIASGTAKSTQQGDTRLLGPGAAIGYLETLAGLHYGATIEATTPVRTLRSRGSAILDVIEDHTDVGLAMLATFSRTLLDGSHATSPTSAPAAFRAGDASGSSRDQL
jgi:CRP-like cAMP-binding protein